MKEYVFATEADNAVTMQPATYTGRHVGDRGCVDDRQRSWVNDGCDDEQEQEPTGGASSLDQRQHEGQSHVYVIIR